MIVMASESQMNSEKLLKKGCYYYEHCSGCRIEKRKRTQKSIPLKTLFSIWIIVLCSSLPISSLFPFLYFMVREFDIAEREEDTSYYAGYVGSAYMLGRALTSVFWGVIADRYGRKPVIILGIISVVVFNALFGLSVNFWMAIVTRFLLGSFNGLMGPIRAYATEVCREEHQAIGLTVISSSWNIGLIIGPALGGWLAQPAKKYPNIFFKESLFERFPYFLPCLIISIFSLGVTISAFWLEESMHTHPNDDSLETGTFCESNGTKKSSQESELEVPPTSKQTSLFKNWPLISSLLVYCIYAFHDMAYGEIFSLWGVSPHNLGGLGYSTNEVGQILCITGLGMFVSEFFGYPIMEKAFGAINTARICSVVAIPVLQMYPYLEVVSGWTGASLWLCLNSASIIKNVLSMSVFTSLFILQNNAVDQGQRGAANGLSMTVMSLAKTLSPACGGALLSWAQKRPSTSFFPGSQIVFFLLNVTQFIAFLFMFKPFLAAS